LFDTFDFGVKYFGRDRPIHSDINMIFYSTGMVGFILFIWFFIRYFFIGNRYISNDNRKLYYPLLIIFLIVLVPGRFIGTLTYAPLLMFLLSAIKFNDRFESVPVNEEQLALS
jgi:CDP-diglyceride synthetase